jgi:hypothetical protein
MVRNLNGFYSDSSRIFAADGDAGHMTALGAAGPAT